MKKKYNKDQDNMLLEKLSNYSEWNRHNLHQENVFMSMINDFQRREYYTEKKRYD